MADRLYNSTNAPIKLVDLGDGSYGVATSVAGSIVEAPTVVTAGVASSVALAANANRKYARFQNDSENAIYLKVGVAAVLHQGIRLNANGGSYEMSAGNGNLDVRAVYCITFVAAQNLLVGEGV